MTRPSNPPGKIPYLYLPPGWNSGWLAAKGAAASAPLYLQIIGDSIATGQGCSDCMAKSWPGLLRNSLQSQLGIALAAEYFTAYGYSPVATSNITNAPWSNALNGVGVTVALSVGWHRTWYVNSGATAVYHQTLTTPYACTAIDLWYIDFQAGTWVYSVDGGSDVTVTNTAPNNNPSSTEVKKISLTGLSAATHTISYGKQSAANVAIVQGATCWVTGNSPASGLHVARMACNGAAAADWNASGQGPANRARLFSGCSPSRDSGSGTALGYPMKNHLTIIEFGINDAIALGANQERDFVACITQMIQGIQRQNPSGSILLLAPCFPDAASDSVPINFNAMFYGPFLRSLASIAFAQNCAFLNMQSKWGETPYAQGFLPNNDVHPPDAGQADIANTILSII
jgi:hypothetical protein